MEKLYIERIKNLLTDSLRALEINDENLRKILSDNKKTVYGKKYSFCEISNGDYYAKKVPLSEYSDYEERICVENEFVAYPIKYILGTSGTTGKQKYFGVDAVIFTAGVGENGIGNRANIVKGLEFMGIKMDAEKNKVRGEETDVSAADATVRTLVIPTNEELMIALDTAALAK